MSNSSAQAGHVPFLRVVLFAVLLFRSNIVSFQNAMDDRNFVSGDLIHGYIPGVVFHLWRVSEEE